MQAFNRAAGVHDPAPSKFPDPPPIPDSEHDLEASHSIRSRPSRSSLPPNRQSSRRTLNEPGSPSSPQLHRHLSSNSAVSRVSGEFVEEGIPWGPQHPCFPHPNPHVSLDSPECTATRVIRVQRDWLISGDLYPAFQNLYPEILAGYVSEPEFRSIIDTTNRLLHEAFDPWTTSNWIDAILGIATGFLWDNTGLTSTKRRVARLEKWLDGWNIEAQRLGKNVVIIGPRRTGFLSLDIQIPDPLLHEPAGSIGDPRTSTPLA